MGKINLLSFEVANLIAAGEVVDRPASAVKELLENAIDSGADRITVEIQRGGISFIRIEDNGCGIEKEDLEPAIKRHSTSKIKDVSDLDAIMTLGFRGEALAAIASVSRLRIFSKTQESPIGAVLEAEGGSVISVTETGCREGTTVIVEDLFFNVPARRKFLKKDSTESTAIGAVVEKIALSHSEISFKYICDGEIKFMTSGNGDLSQTIWALFGKETSKRSLKVDREENGIRISGYVSEPDLYRSNRNMENFFINGRYIKSKTAAAALEQAYSSKIPADKFPFCVLNISLPPQAVDVNVHPAKLEVKFANEKLIFDAVYYAVISALEAEANRPELHFFRSDDSEKSAASPERSPSVFRTNERHSPSASKNPHIPAGMSTSQIKNAFTPIDVRVKKADQIKLSDIVPAVDTINETTKTHIGAEADVSIDDSLARHKIAEENLKNAQNFVSSYITLDELEAEERQKQKIAVQAEKSATETDENAKKRAEEKRAAEATMDASLGCTISPSDIPDYTIIGEAFNCYVLVQIDERLLMIDKHAAHERIIFDELCRQMRANLRSADDSFSGQLLLSPIELELLGTEAEALSEHILKIHALGFDYSLENKTVSTVKISISQIPEGLERESALELFITLANALSETGASVEATVGGFFETRLWQASCKAAIKGGRIYDVSHIKWICDRLLKKPDEKNQVIRTCPHGRPVAFEIKKSAIDRQFARLT